MVTLLARSPSAEAVLFEEDGVAFVRTIFMEVPRAVDNPARVAAENDMVPDVQVFESFEELKAYVNSVTPTPPPFIPLSDYDAADVIDALEETETADTPEDVQQSVELLRAMLTECGGLRYDDELRSVVEERITFLTKNG